MRGVYSLLGDTVCVLCIFIVYRNTNTYIHIFKKNMFCLYCHGRLASRDKEGDNMLELKELHLLK